MLRNLFLIFNFLIFIFRLAFLPAHACPSAYGQELGAII